MLLDILGLSKRTINILHRAGIETIDQLQSYSDDDLLLLRYVGQSTIDEIRSRQSEFDTSSHSQTLERSRTEHFRVSPEGSEPISDWNLSTRTVNALGRSGIHTINDLLRLETEEIRKIRGIGDLSLIEIDDLIKKIDIEIIEVIQSDSVKTFLFPNDPLKVIPGNTHLNELPLSEHALSCLRENGYRTVADLFCVDEDGLVSIMDLEVTSPLEEILEVRQTLESTTSEYSETILNILKEFGIKELPSELSWRYLLLIGQSWEDIELLEKALIEVGLSGLPKIPDDCIVGHEVLEYLLRIGCPLQQINSGRATANQTCRLKLHSAGIRTLIHICLLRTAELEAVLGEESKQYYEDLDWYLQQLPSFDWERELNATSPNPVVVWRLQSYPLQIGLTNAIVERGFTERDLNILLARLPSPGSQLPSLDELGKKFGVTRERVRQIEARGKRIACDALNTNEMIKTFTILAKQIINEQGMITQEDLADALIDIYEIKEEACEQTLLQILFLTNDLYYDKSLDAFISPDINVDLPVLIHSHLLQMLNEAKAPILETDVRRAINSKLSEVEVEVNEQFQLWNKVLEDSVQYERIEERYWGLTKWENRVLDEVVMALRESGEPTHFKEITKLANKRLRSDQQTTTQATHGKLGHHQDLFVRTGPGTFGLREWDPDCPAQPEKFRTLITQVLKEADEPLSIDEIFKKVHKLRAVKRTTVIMYLQLHDDYSVDCEGFYGLTEWEEAQYMKSTVKLPAEFEERLKARAERAFANREERAG